MSIQSVERAFAVLRVLAQGPAGVTEVADRADLPKSTTARLLSSLVGQGAVEQDPDTLQYRVGALIGDLAAAVVPGGSLAAVARPHLSHLAETVGEAAGISVRDGRSALYLDEVAPPSDVRMRDWVGTRTPLHAVPAGLIMLAYARVDDVARYLGGELEQLTDKTMTDTDQLMDRFRRIRGQTHEWVFGELADDVNSVAAPVRDHSGRVVAALVIHGPAYRFPGPDRTAVESALVESAQRMSEML